MGVSCKLEPEEEQGTAALCSKQAAAALGALWRLLLAHCKLKMICVCGCAADLHFTKETWPTTVVVTGSIFLIGAPVLGARSSSPANQCHLACPDHKSHTLNRLFTRVCKTKSDEGLHCSLSCTGLRPWHHLHFAVRLDR